MGRIWRRRRRSWVQRALLPSAGIALAAGALFLAAINLPSILPSEESSTTVTATTTSVNSGMAVAEAAELATPILGFSNVPPTYTPSARESTPTVRATNTRRPTVTPSITPIIPTRTPTKTPTATATGTALPTPTGSPTVTRAPFEYTRTLAATRYTGNYANSAGCNWLGIAGEVFDIDGAPVRYGLVRVHVWGSGVDQRVLTGTQRGYGPSGWEVYLGDIPRIQTHSIQLELISGKPVSDIFSVRTRSSCNENLVQFDFEQNH